MTAATTGTVPSAMAEAQLSIRGMTCASCAARVEKLFHDRGITVAASSAFVVANSLRLRRFGTTRRTGRGRPAARPAPGQASGQAPGQAEACCQPQEEALSCQG